jgi:hypothetical protein
MTMVPAGTKTVPPAGRMVTAPFPIPEKASGAGFVCCSVFVPVRGRIGFAVGWIGDVIGAIRIGPDDACEFWSWAGCAG